jgi:hypothetical protein
MGGEWWNNYGSGAFVHGNNTVEFENDESPLSINGTTTFYRILDNTEGGSHLVIIDDITVSNRLTVNNKVVVEGELYAEVLNIGEAFTEVVFESGSYSEVQSLWQGGTITSNNGYLLVDDIRDDYLRGTYIINGGFVEIQQDASDFVDLGADITITDGYLDIYGGSSISKWPRQTSGINASITMSGGQLFIASQGIEIEDNSTSYSFTENITGGTIRTNGHFYCRGTATNFSPSGGVVLLTGNSNSDCAVYDTGNALWILKVNKNTGNAVKNSHEINVRNSLIIQKGIFSDMGLPVNVGQ